MFSRFRAWLRVKRGHGTTTETSNKDDTEIAPSLPPSSTLPQPPRYETCVPKPGQPQGATAPAAATPAAVAPPLSDQATLALLRQANLPREDETMILETVDFLMPRAYAGMARSGYDRKTTTAIADAIREGAIAAAVTVHKATVKTTWEKLDDDINEGCRKVTDAVIAATAAGPAEYMMSTASTVVECINFVARRAVRYKKLDKLPHAVANQLIFTTQGVVAAISAGVINNDNLCLSDFPLPSRSKFLLIRNPGGRNPGGWNTAE